MSTLSIIFDLATILIIAVCVWLGVTRGFLKSLFRLVSAVASLFIAKALYPATKIFMEKIFIKDIFRALVLGSLKPAVNTEISESAVRSLGLPEFLNKAFINSNYFTQVKNDASATITTAVGEFVSDYALAMLAYVVTFILVSLVIFFILILINIFSKLPVISGIDCFLGGFAGFISACIIIWLILAAAAILLVSPDYNYIFTSLDNSIIAIMFYRLNPILSFISASYGGL